MNAALKNAIECSVADISLVKIDAGRHDSRPKVAYRTVPCSGCGERTDVRGDGLFETAFVRKTILRESRFQRW
jgi:hypothetical protein